MALADSARAIGKATELLRQSMNIRTGIEVTVGRPDQTGGAPLPAPRLNLFLYEALFDPHLKNQGLDSASQPPLWLVLKYLITSFDEHDESDTVEALENLGRGLSALQELSFLELDTIALPAPVRAALKDNPETLKLTFDEAPSDLLSKLMQGSDERYRFSMAFELRPVMIAPAEPPSYSLLVGVDYTTTPPEVIGEAGINIPVIPSMGPVLIGVSPERFAVNDVVTITGVDLNVSGLVVRLGAAELPVIAQRPDGLGCRVDGSVAGGTIISAGAHLLTAVQVLPSGRERSSKPLIAALLPTLQNVTTTAGVVVPGPPPTWQGNLVLTGLLLGSAKDDITVALVQEDRTVRVVDDGFTIVPAQTGLTLQINGTPPLPVGLYRVVLLVNGQQARNSPTVALGV